MPFGSAGEIRFGISIDDANAINKLQSVGQQFTTLGNSTQQATQQMQDLPPALQEIKDGFQNASVEIKTMQDELEKNSQEIKKTDTVTKSFGSTLKSNIISITTAISGIIGLVQQYTQLQRAQNNLERAQNVEIGMRNRITALTLKHADAVAKYGANSAEAAKIERDLTLLTEKHTVQVQKLEIMQQQLNERMADFAVNILPNLISTGGGIAQVVIGMKQLRNEQQAAGEAAVVMGRRMKFALIGTGIGAALVAIGGFLAAFGNNWLGVRDAVNAAGKAIGDFYPTLKPILNLFGGIGQGVVDFFGGDIPKQAQEVTDAFDDVGVSLTELNKKMDDMKVRGQEVWKALAMGDKGERKDLFSVLGIKGGAKKRLNETLNEIENVIKKMSGLGKLLDFEFQLPDINKLFDVPKSVTKKAAFTLADRIRDIGKDTKFKSAFNDLAKLIEADAKEGGKHTGEIIGKFLIDNPALLAALKANGLLPPSVIAEIDRQRVATAQEVTNDKKWDAAFADTRTPQEILDDAWWDKNLPEGSGPKNPFMDLVQSAIDAFKSGDFSGISTSIRINVLDPIVKGLETIGSNLPGIIQTALQNGIKEQHPEGLSIESFFTKLFENAGKQDEKNKNTEFAKWIKPHVDSFFDQLFNTENWNRWFNEKVNTFKENPLVKFLSNPIGYIMELLMHSSSESRFKGKMSPSQAVSKRSQAGGGIKFPTPQEILDTIGFNQLVNNIATAWAGIQNTISQNAAIKGIGAFLNDPMGTILKGLKDVGIIQEASGETGSIPTITLTIGGVDVSKLESDTQGGANKMKSIWNELASDISKINLAIAKSWSKVMNQNITNTKSGVSGVVSRMNGMASSLSKIFLAIAKSWSKTMNSMISNAKSGVNGVINQLNRIPRKIVTTHEIHTVTSQANGGIMSFAKGGIIKAANGYLQTSHGPTTVMFGDNPGGREVHAFIPTNNPGPTMERLESMFGRAVESNNNQPIILNATFKLDGNEVVNTRKWHEQIRYNAGRNRTRMGPS